MQENKNLVQELIQMRNVEMDISINNHVFKVKTLTDAKSQQIGMMGKKFSNENEGMLFLIGNTKLYFWTKNCIIPLDIIMIKNNVIVNIHHNCPPCVEENCPEYSGNGNVVLELNGGTCEKLNIQAGDTINYLF